MAQGDQQEGAGGTTIGGGVDTLDRGELAADFGASYSIGLILANKELLVLAYRAQGWSNARIDKRTGKIIKGKQTKEVWEPTRIAAEIALTDWYKSRDGNIREADNAKAMDPASWNRRVDQLATNIVDEAKAAGADITGVDPRAYAERMLRENWLSIDNGPDAQVPQKLLDDFLAPLIRPVTGNTFTGAAESTAALLRKRTRDYGVTFSDQWFAKAVQGLKSGDITEADLDAEILAQSKSRYSGINSLISEQRSVQDLADPYIELMARTLERNPGELSLADPLIQSALQFTDPTTGQVRTKSLWEFEQELRQRPEWGNTTEGRRALNDGAMEMLKSFGFYE